MAQSLVEKLLIKPGYRIALLNAPERYQQLLGDSSEGVTLSKTLDGKFDFIHLFVRTRAELEQYAGSLKPALKDGGVLWISYPKGKALDTDLNRDILHTAAQVHGLEGVSLISIDDTWSAMRFKPI